MSAMTAEALVEKMGWTDAQTDGVIAELEASVVQHLASARQFNQENPYTPPANNPFADLAVDDVDLPQKVQGMTVRELFFSYD